MVNLIEHGQRNLPADKKQLLINHMQSLSEQLQFACEWISQPQEKILLQPSKGSMLIVDQEGIRIRPDLNRDCASPLDLVLMHVDTVSPIPDFLKLVFALAHHGATQTGSNAELLQLLDAYFDLRAITFQPEFYLVEHPGG